MRATDSDPRQLGQIEQVLGLKDWAGLADLRTTWLDQDSHAAAALCDYHLALAGPPELVATVLRNPASVIAVGPLHEVAAQHHTWRQLAPHLSAADAVLFGQERALRCDLISAPHTPPDEAMPYAVQDWEPSYPLADYRHDRVGFHLPPEPTFSLVERLPSAGEAIGDPHVVDVFKDLGDPWWRESGGAVAVVTVEGDHLNAIAALDVRQARVTEASFAEALAWLGWAGASGGANGTRRGAGVGRRLAWWCVAALAGVSEDWPIDPAEMREIGESLHWCFWSADNRPSHGTLRLAVHDDVEELGLAISATDGSSSASG